MSTTYGIKKRVTRLMAGVWLEYAYSMLIATLRITPNEITARRSRDYGSSVTRLRLTISLLLLFVLGNGSVWGQTGITSLSQITDADGHYIINEDISGGTSGVTAFNGILEAAINPETHMPYRITGLSAPLFTTLTGTVKNIVLEGVTISGNSGNTGAIACTAEGAARIYNVGILSGSVGGTTNTGGLVGFLDGTARVVNCYSYANITSGTNKAGIVGYNNIASSQSNVATMVMNCMFYGEISSGGSVSPIYGGTEINNVADGLNNYNYYRYNSSYSKDKQITKYNRALAMEEKFLKRFERYRLLLNSNRKLAAKYASTTITVEPSDMAKWVLETADKSISGRDPYPYPILKAQGYYPSIINPDVTNAPDSATVGRNNGGKLPSPRRVLNVNISSSKTSGGQSWPLGASVTRSTLTLERTDKDTTLFNFNYDKVQLPYYNDIGTGNYTRSRVVTGWKITSITGGTAGTFTAADEWGGYNFADRKCTNKDLYSVSGRVFSQGAYFDVPEGVTAITIEPYWAIANYVSDETYDVVYNKDYAKQNFTPFGTQYKNNSDIDIYGDGNKQKVYTSISNAIGTFNNDSKTVYDQAVVLVGNVHQYANPTNTNKPYTLMSIDMNHDNEPDYSYIFSHDNRRPIDPIRYDFLNIMGIAEAQIPKEATLLRNVSIFNLKGWFEITNTCVVNFSQFEIENSKTSQNAITKSPAPLILLGGSFEQIASTQKTANPASTQYIHIGGNAWFAKFGIGTHSDGTGFTPHRPVSVTGGDYEEFYLSGTYQPDATVQSDNAECYISGGRFGEMAGASMEAIDGDVQWDINWADITNFYGGGVNAVNPITGKIQVDITNSYVNQYCGGPKFGDMVAGKTVTTNATGCVFGTYFGAGYGGNAYKRLKYKDEQNKEPKNHQGEYLNERGKYYNGTSSSTSYGKKGKGVATDFDYEFFVWSSGGTGARFYVNFITFSLATTRGVTSNLTKCKVTGNVYGGGSLGKVDGDVSTTLNSCEISGNVFGGGYSATLPKIFVRKTPAFIAGKEPTKNMNIGMFEPGEINTTDEYEWKQVSSMPANGQPGMVTEDGKNYVYTDTDLSGLGTVTGKVTLTINGTTTVAKSVYGGGEESGVGDGTEGDGTEVNVMGGTIGTEGQGGVEYGNVFGGGKGKVGDKVAGYIKGNTQINISGSPTILHNVYGGGAYGSVGDFTYDPTSGMPIALATENTGNASVAITGGTIGTNGKENGMVFGSSRGDVATPADDGIDPNDRMAWVYSTNVTIGTAASETGPSIAGSVYGSGENGHTFQNTQLNIHSGVIGITDSEDEDGGARYAYRGNVYGGGCGTDTIIKTEGEGANAVSKTYYNFNAGIVLGNTRVDMDGGHVVHNVYGGGAMGSVGTYTFDENGKPVSCAENTGTCTINITGGKIGMHNATMTGHGNDGPDDFGHVFGAGRGTTADPILNPNIETCAFFDNTKLTIGGTALVCGSVYGGSESGHVLHNTDVEIKGGQIGCGAERTAAYTDDEFALSTSLPATNHWAYTPAGMGAPYDQYANAEGEYPDGSSAEGGKPVATDGRTFFGNVFAGGSGFYPYAPGKWLKSAGHIGGTASVTVSGGHILNNLYGGCEMADIEGAVTVTMTGGTVGVPRTKDEILANPNCGNIYGAGMGDKRIFFNTSTNVASTTIDISNGTIYGAVYGGGEDGHVMGDAVTTISQPEGKATIIGCDGESGYDGNVFGAGQGHVGALTAGVVGGNASLTITGGTLKGSAYGGGRIASVGTYFAMADDPRYGKMQEEDGHGDLSVSLTGGIINQNVYGGCMGTTEDINYGISKNVSVELNNGVDDADQGCVVKGVIFGCNNVNSSPEGTSDVHIYKTQRDGASRITNTAEVKNAKDKGTKDANGEYVLSSFDVPAVYGGGNLAAYTPKDENGSTNVIIDGCDRTSIGQVYGGGNAASTPATKVTVNGTFEIGELFGGGNGKDRIIIDGVEKDNPGANVGFKDYSAEESTYDTKEKRTTGDSGATFISKYVYGTGLATVNIKGGTIHRVFGGSNTKGNVRQTALTMLEEVSAGGAPLCDFCVDEAYGGGKSAPMDAEAKLLMACIPGLNEVYGGAEAADIHDDVTLTITNGSFNRVFGGNNISGTISGKITVNVEETGCRPVIIGELYGGGNLAAYSKYGYDEDGNPKESGSNPSEDPVVNVRSFTSIGAVYGGGYGTGAKMIASPTVNINESLGTPDIYPTTGSDYDENGFKGKTITFDAGTPTEHTVTLPAHTKGKIGAIGDVFGGGNAAEVKGNTTVNVGTLSENTFVSVDDDNTTDTDESKLPVVGVDIRGNVYGGGNNAEVTGDTHVTIGKEATP